MVGRHERDAAIAGHIGFGGTARPCRRHVAVHPLMSGDAAQSILSNSVTLSAMHTASGNKSGHIMALIAVGVSSVGDVCCCR